MEQKKGKKYCHLTSCSAKHVNNYNNGPQTSPACGSAAGDASKLCVCTDVKVPDIPIDYDNVEVIWKLLDVSASNPPTNPGDCEKEFNEDNLRCVGSDKSLFRAESFFF
jgi:hypothetical protein